jgi:hypothetical protein
MLEITLEQVKAAALDIIKEVGKEYGYANVDPGWWNEEQQCGNYACQYTKLKRQDTDGPACLVGRILHYLGVPLHEMRQTCSADDLFRALEVDGVAFIDHATRGLLQIAQAKQDVGRTWFESLLAADLIYPEEV